MIYKSKDHIGSALSIIDILSALYNGIMNINPKSPDYKGRDRFILSKGCVRWFIRGFGRVWFY